MDGVDGERRRPVDRDAERGQALAASLDLTFAIGGILAGAAGVLLLGTVRPNELTSALVLGALGFVMAARTFASGAGGLELAPDRRLAVMGVRAAALQFGYLVGSAAGGVALLLAGYSALGVFFAVLLLGAAAAYALMRRAPA